MIRTKSSYLAMIAVLLSPVAAYAIPITWTLTDILFDDGGTATGSFVYDEDFQSVSAISIQTSLGTTLPGSLYSDLLATNQNGSAATKVTFGSIPGGGDFTNEFVFDLFLAGIGLTNAGGTIAIEINGNGENQCADAICEFLSAQRSVISGSLVGDDDSTSVPEPGTLALLGIGLFGMGMARRKKV